jgi:AcrR family transcriptional regulator
MVPRAKQRTPELRDHLLSVAVDLLVREGVGGFTARNIAYQGQTSTPALYELFGDRAGLLREVYFEAFRRMDRHLRALSGTDDPRADLIELVRRYRGFLGDNPTLTELMFSRPFADFRPGPDEIAAGDNARALVVDQVRRCIDADILHGDATDIALLLDSLLHGLSAAESAGRLGASTSVIDRRWRLGVESLLSGVARDRERLPSRTRQWTR